MKFTIRNIEKYETELTTKIFSIDKFVTIQNAFEEIKANSLHLTKPLEKS